jgi:hypothetical protein
MYASPIVSTCPTESLKTEKIMSFRRRRRRRRRRERERERDYHIRQNTIINTHVGVNSLPS